MGLNALTIIMLITGIVSISAFSNQALMDRLMYVPARIKNGGSKVGILGHALIHADWIHLILNLMVVYSLGEHLLLEFRFHFGEVQGQIHFVLLYVLGALFATVIPYARHQHNPGYRSLGASGAVSAVVFAFIVWNPFAELGLLFIPVYAPAWVFGLVYLAVEYFLDKRGGTGIAHDAHIGGAIFGVIYAFSINIDKGKEYFDLIFG